MSDMKHILEEALRLPPVDRAALADELLASLHDASDEAVWAAEIERRAASDESTDTEWEDVRAAVDAEHGYKK